MNEKLLMQIGLIDQVTKPLRGITKQLDQTMQNSKQGMRDMVTGGAGLVATGFAIQNALMPAIEMDRKVGEVKSLGVTDDALKTLSQTALKFSTKYGKSAAEFVDASYDIKSAMGSLDGKELAGITRSSAILAAATKSDTKTITDYMGTMYGIFDAQAKKMGKVNWAAQVAGMTAKSVEMFKTDGNKMAQSFSRLGSSATAFGVDMSEQMAVLGTLGSSMDGGQAATKYTAFLSNAAMAQKKLGLSFFDSTGKMLPMVDMLDKIQKKVGHFSTDKQFQVLKDAFGSVEAVKLIQNLQSKTGSLTKQINELGKINGMKQAEKMASAMTDQWERLGTSWFAIRAAAFGAILPAINSVVGSIADGMGWLTGMTDEFPILTQVMSYAAIGAITLGGVVSALSLAMGIGRMMSSGWAVTMGVFSNVLKVARLATLAFTGATWLMNAAFWANPITWVVAAIVALIAAVGAVIVYWDDLKASFGDLSVFKVLTDVIDWVIKKLNLIPGIDIEWRAGDMPEMKNVADTESMTKSVSKHSRNSANDPVYQATKTMPESSSYPLSQHIDNRVSNQYLSHYQNTGKEINQNFSPSVIDYKKPEKAPKLTSEIVRNITSSQHHANSNIRQFGDVYITTPNGLTPDQLAEWDELNVG